MLAASLALPRSSVAVDGRVTPVLKSITSWWTARNLVLRHLALPHSMARAVFFAPSLQRLQHSTTDRLPRARGHADKCTQGFPKSENIFKCEAFQRQHKTQLFVRFYLPQLEHEVR